MNHISEVLKDGITVHDVLINLKKREKEFWQGESLRQRGETIKRLFPNIYMAQAEQGKQCLNGMAVLPGSASPHFIGNPVKWKENPFHDAEYTYFLHRMDHWRTMLEAYSLTGEEPYAQKVMEEFHDWIEQCPRQPLYDESGSPMAENFGGCGCNQGIWRSLETGIRMYRTWPHIIHHLIDTEYINEAFLEQYLKSVFQHAEVLYVIPPILWPKADHNHYLMENNGLLYLSCMFPEFKDSELWKAHALRELERSILAQVTSGGGQIEGCPSYHNGCIYWFVLPVLLSKKYHFTLSSGYLERLQRMAEYSVHATRPSSGNCPWGDSNTYTGTLSWGALCHYLAFEDSSYILQARTYYSHEDLEKAASKYIWEAPDLTDLYHVLDVVKDSGSLPTLPTVSWQKDLKQVFLRTDWSQNALSLMFACRTPIQNAHAHMDPAGFDFTAYGRPLLTDPGIFCYRDDEDRKKFKSVHWHNCLTVNHKDPWEYISSWSYGEQQPGDILQVQANERLMYAAAQHHNYSPAIHKRVTAIVDKEFLFVLDLLEEVTPGSSVQINFHMDSPAAMADSDRCFARSLSGGPDIGIFSDSQAKPSLIPARRSTKSDVAHNTMIARFEAEHLTGGRHGFVTVAYPVPTGKKMPEVTGIRKEFEESGAFLASFQIDGREYKLALLGNDLSFLSSAGL